MKNEVTKICNELDMRQLTARLIYDIFGTCSSIALGHFGLNHEKNIQFIEKQR